MHPDEIPGDCIALYEWTNSEGALIRIYHMFDVCLEAVYYAVAANVRIKYDYLPDPEEVERDIENVVAAREKCCDTCVYSFHYHGKFLSCLRDVCQYRAVAGLRKGV